MIKKNPKGTKSKQHQKIKNSDLQARQAIDEMNMKQAQSLDPLIEKLLNAGEKSTDPLSKEDVEEIVDIAKEVENNLDEIEDNASIWKIIGKTLFNGSKKFKQRIKALPSKISQWFIGNVMAAIQTLVGVNTKQNTLEQLEELQKLLGKEIKKL